MEQNRRGPHAPGHQIEESSMSERPRWLLPVSILALLWNLLGCAAYLHDALMTPADVAQLDAAQQAIRAARPAWSVGATAVAVWCGALGCLGLALRRRWSMPLLAASLAGVIVQDISLFGMGDAIGGMLVHALVLQGVVLVVAVALLLLARRANAAGWT
jgi:hypothetical protein